MKYSKPHPCCDDSCLKPDALAQRLEAVERFGDAIMRWVTTLTVTISVAAVSAAYVAQYLDGK